MEERVLIDFDMGSGRVAFIPFDATLGAVTRVPAKWALPLLHLRVEIDVFGISNAMVKVLQRRLRDFTDLLMIQDAQNTFLHDLPDPSLDVQRINAYRG